MMIDKNSAWHFVRSNAEKALKTKMVFTSLVEESPYQIIQVEADKISIQRLNTRTVQKLNRKKVEGAIDRINASNGRIRRRTLISPTVAEETTLVLFHPQLTWDETCHYIIVVNE